MGYQADLILLEGDPLADLEILRSPLGIMKRGRWVPSTDLSDELTSLENRRR